MTQVAFTLSEERPEGLQVVRLAPRERGASSGPRLVSDQQLSLFTTEDQEAKRGIDIYREAAWSYAAISQIAADISSLPYILRSGSKDEDAEIEGDVPARILLDEPNAVMSYGDLIEAMIVYLYTTGRSINWLSRAGALPLTRGGVPEEVWPIRSDLVHVETKPPAGIVGYVYRDDVGQSFTFAPQDVLAIRFFDPLRPIGGGLSPLRACILQIYLEQQSIKWNTKFFKNGAAPSIVVTDPNFVTPEESERKRIEMQHSWGGTDNAFNMLYLGNFQGKVEAFKADHKEMGFLEMLKEVRRAQLASIGTPPALAGEFDGQNLAQVEMQERTYWTKTLLPLRNRIQNSVNRFLMRRVQRGAFYSIDISGVKVLQEDLTQKAQREAVLIASGLRSRKELREADGLPAYPGSEEFLLSSTLVPAKTKEEREAEAEQAREDAMGAGGGDAAPPAPRGEKRALALVTNRMTDPKKELARAASWRSFDLRLKRADRELESVWTRVLDELSRHVVRRVRQTMPSLEAVGSRARADTAPLMIPLPGDPSDYLPEADDLIREVTTAHGRVYRRIVARFGEQAVDEIRAGLVFDAGAPSVLTLVERDEARVGREVMRLLDDLRDTLEGGINAGETVADLVDRIRGQVSPARAERIARTEALAAANSGTVEGYRQSGVEQMEWLTARDAFVREAHAAVDGDRVNLGEAFEVGGERMDFPGDPMASPGNTVNCRCTVAPVAGGL